MECGLFQRVSGIVSSETVLAHIRKATQGEHSSLNSHPFQYGRWVMAHNGDIPNFSDVREELLGMVAPILRRYILGDTDSEVIFYLFLTALSREVELHRQGTQLPPTIRALRNTVNLVRQIADKDDHRALLTIAITNGELMVVHEGGKDLHVSTHKSGCNESDSCPFYKPECVAPTESGYVSHFIASSEPLQGQNVWRKLNEGDIVAVDFHMKYHEELASKHEKGVAAADAA